MPRFDLIRFVLSFKVQYCQFIQMEIDSCSQDKLQAYSVLFHRTRFAFVSKINIENLKYFSIETQQRLGKIPIKLNIHSLKLLRNNTNFNYLVMTEYQQIIPLIYLLRSQPPECKILVTKIALEIAQIYAQDFYNVIKKMNQIVSVPCYEKESQAYDSYQIEFQIDFGTWVGIFQGEEIQKFVDRCVCVNYGERYDTNRGNILTAYPSGISIGSAVWILENSQTKNKVLWVQGISHHEWRACQEFYVDPAHNEISNVVFTAGVLSNPTVSIQDEQQCLEFLKAILQRLCKSNNSRIVLQDFLAIPDIINYISFQFRDKFKKLFFTGVSINKMMSYVNSYPEFLTFNHKKRIYEDPPVYPFDTYEQMREKFIAEGTIEEISAEKKLPPKELILRSTPYLHFQSDFHAYLVEGENQVAEIICEKFYDLNKLRGFLSSRKINKIICLCKLEQDIKNIPDLGHSFSLNILEQNIFIPDENLNKQYIAEGPIPNLICKYKKKNGWLKLYSIQEKFRQLSKEWPIKLEEQFRKYGIETVSKSEHSFATQKTKIWIADYKIHIEGQDTTELKIADQMFNQFSRLFKLA